MLVDLFVECVGQRVRRSHFHRFMHDAHARLRALRAEAHEDPVATVATELADGLDVLCFDELYVNDIADAMIIGGLFEGLNDAGVTLVVTSNVAPRQLYRDGLQRSRFLPTIDLLERVTVVAEVDAGIDYRLRRLERAPMTVRSSPDSELWLSERFDGLARPDARSSGCIQIEGRPVAYRRMHAGIVWFDFKALCEGPRGTDDYIEIARQFDTVLISDVPVLGGDDNAARRFVALVDEFYERGVKLLLSTAGAFEQLYTGERLAFEFRRTVSRLIEMQSHAYLARPHLP
jgi:cell division protein ZapE